MTDKAGQKVGAGEYKAVITVLAVNSEFNAVIYFHLKG